MICFLFTTGVDVYRNTEMAETADKTNEISNVFNETECARLAFNQTFECYAATFDHLTGLCRSECTSFPNVPENITLVDSSTNKTLLLHRGHHGKWLILPNTIKMQLR
jgi:hypothetical protein